MGLSFSKDNLLVLDVDNNIYYLMLAFLSIFNMQEKEQQKEY